MSKTKWYRIPRNREAACRGGRGDARRHLPYRFQRPARATACTSRSGVLLRELVHPRHSSHPRDDSRWRVCRCAARRRHSQGLQLSLRNFVGWAGVLRGPIQGHPFAPFCGIERSRGRGPVRPSAHQRQALVEAVGGQAPFAMATRRMPRRRKTATGSYWLLRYRRLRVPRELVWRCQECRCSFREAQAKRRRRGEREIRSLKARTCSAACRRMYRTRIIRRWDRLHPERVKPAAGDPQEKPDAPGHEAPPGAQTATPEVRPRVAAL